MFYNFFSYIIYKLFFLLTAVTLSEKDPLSQFAVSEAEKSFVDHKLIIKQIVLGAEAKEGEYNVVQVIRL